MGDGAAPWVSMVREFVLGMVPLGSRIIFLLGWPFEWPAIILVFLPIVLPLVHALKIVVLFGVLAALSTDGVPVAIGRNVGVLCEIRGAAVGAEDIDAGISSS